jgi:hypothetical protein
MAILPVQRIVPPSSPHPFADPLPDFFAVYPREIAAARGKEKAALSSGRIKKTDPYLTPSQGSDRLINPYVIFISCIRKEVPQ